jgi:hypothetical protein
MLIFSSIFLQNFKGIIYISGLLLACFFSIIVGKSFQYESQNTICKTISISKDGSLSKLPLSQVVLNFTFFYLVYIIGSNNLANQNIPTLIIFPLLIIGDILWNWYNSCYQIPQIITALIIGSGIGFMWSYIITRVNMPDLLYFNGVSNSEICSRPSQSTFRCSVYKGGELISSN